VSPRPQIDHIRKPQILAAAAEVIAERGIAATRVADVAERAGTSAPAILYWFSSKDELLAEALTYEEERFSADITDRLSSLPGSSERLRLLIEESADGNDWKLWMELWTQALRDRDAERARRELDARWRAMIEQIVAEGQETGEFGGPEPEEVAATLACVLDGLAVQRTLGDPEMPRRRMSELALGVAEELLDCPLRASPDGGKRFSAGRSAAK
jgi:AcrR family transcriptional regulator